MNTVRAYPWILIGWLLSGMAGATAVKPLPASAFEDWSGFVREFDLKDQSVLFEYTARSYSARVNSAMLAMSFVPRFNCEPTINVRLPVEVQAVPSNPRLEFTFGRKQLTYPGLVDRVGNMAMYSVAAPASEIGALRDLLVLSSRVSVRVFSSSDSSSTKATEGFELAYSLLGSRLATSAAEKHCLSHTPIAYDPK